MSKETKKFVIIDGNALLHRAWHALPPLTTRSGQLVNAVYGFASIMLTIIRELKPDFGAVAFDPPGKTFRHDHYSDYKATRQKQPDELYDQIPQIKEVAEKFGFQIVERARFEADDVIGTLAHEARRHHIKTIIVTGDMDALQLVDDTTEVFTIKKGISDTITYDRKAVKEKYGFGPEKIIEYKALAGDSSDNIPGVAGVGDKTAKQLLETFDSIEEMYAYLEKDSGKKIKESVAKKLRAHKKEAFLSKELATIAHNLDVKFSQKTYALKPAQTEDIFELFRALEFRSLVSRAQEVLGAYNDDVADGQRSIFASQHPDAPFVIRKGYTLISSEHEAQKLAERLARAKDVAIDTETDDLGALSAAMLGMSLSVKRGEAYYIPTAHVSAFAGMLKDKNIRKIGHNIKYDIEVLHRAGFEVAGPLCDTRIASYLLHPAGRSHSLDNLAFVELKHKMVPIEDLIGPRGKKQRSLKDVSLSKVADYAAEDADYTFRLERLLLKQLQEEELSEVFETIEMPLLPVLVNMEENGVKIDVAFLKKMSSSIGTTLNQLEKKIINEAGEPFNVNSPIQLKKILFEKLEISTKGVGRTKTGFSTAAGELEKLKDMHPIIPLIMEHRELFKLKSTYLDALPKLVHKETGRVHTTFNQAVASTGRLSSSDPNLQNIPIRTQLGREIRKAFIAERGNVLISADYSQIELRVAADLSGDERLIEIFKSGKDIHTTTASYVHQIPESKVTPEIRRTAKEVNFGVLYGMGAHGLSTRTGMSYQRSKEFIERYFSAFSTLEQYIEESIERARELGYAKTRFGRKLSLPDLHSGVQQIRAAAERLAINMPMQGTTADIMKLAMIAIYDGLSQVSPKAKMLMQVHDELVFEIPKKDTAKVSRFIEHTMDTVVSLAVPIKAEVHSGKNWQVAH